MSLLRHDALIVERAIDDLKRGVPVIIENESRAILVLPIEYLDQASLDLLAEFSADETPQILLTATRAHTLNPSIQFDSPIKVPFLDIPNARALGGLIKDVELPSGKGLTSADTVEQAALALIKIGEFLPSAIMCQIDKPLPNSLLVLTQEHIQLYKQQIILSLNEMSRAPLPLQSAHDSSIVAFRSPLGGKEHYAIIVGNIKGQKDPLVRVHSSCYTGDLIGSLSCDCRDQLHTAIRLMAEGEGGVILYLQQEGRGIGLTNKVRAYALKEQGMDTVDANEALGFDDDERLFEPAAEMLKKLNIKTIKLLSNNPRKAEGLKALGIKVSTSVPHIMPIHQHNSSYLQTKATRLGHTIKAKSSSKTKKKA